MKKDLEFLEVVGTYSDLCPASYQYFNQLMNHRTILFNSEVDENIIETVYLPLKDFEKDDSLEPVTLILNSVGGSVADGLMICNVIDSYTKKLNIIVPSYACSMGTIILCSGNRNPNVIKKCYPFSFGLIHSGQTFVGGESHVVDDVIDFNRGVDNRIKEYIVENTQITRELYEAHYRKQWYLDAETMKKLGLIHEIIGRENWL